MRRKRPRLVVNQFMFRAGGVLENISQVAIQIMIGVGTA
jgi:hypothetical protein